MSTTCPVCGAALAAEPVDVHGSDVLLDCRSCELQVWVGAKPADAAWYGSSVHYLAMPYVDQLGWYHSWALSHLPGEARTLLDIGCADGRFVYAAARKGVDARGIDHSARSIRLGNTRHGGERLSVRSIEDLRSTGERFDVVTLFEVIEHVEDPLALLRLAASLTSDQGVIVVSTPNRSGFPKPPRDVDVPPHHLTRWTPKALRTALERAGFPRSEVALSPAEIGIHEFILDRTRIGIVTGILKRREGKPVAVGPRANADVRALIRAKDLLATAGAKLLAPVLGHRFGGASMVAIARRS